MVTKVTKVVTLVRMVVAVKSFNLVLWLRLTHIVMLMMLIIKLMVITKSIIIVMKIHLP